MRSRPSRRRLFSACAAKYSGSAIKFPAPGSGPSQTGFGRDDQLVRIRVERLADRPLAHVGAVRIGSVDERDPERGGAAAHVDHLIVIARLAQTPGPGSCMLPKPSRTTGRSPSIAN